MWKHAIVSDGKAIHNPLDSKPKMVSTAQLKIELTEKFDKAAQKKAGQKQRQSQSQMAATQSSFPAGAKYHMYREVLDDMNDNRNNYWEKIMGLLGV